MVIMMIIIRTLLPHVDDKGEVRLEAVSRSSPYVDYAFYRLGYKME